MQNKSFGWRSWQQMRPNNFVFLNEQIKAPNIIIIDEDGNKLWTFPRARALIMKDEAWLDLVQISYDRDTMVSTTKLIDYGKYKYNKGKEDKEKKKKQQSKWVKELKIKYAIGDNDLDMKLNKAIEFLWDWYGVKISMKLRWRENIYQSKAREKMEEVLAKLSEHGKPRESTPKKEANGYSVVLFGKKK